MRAVIASAIAVSLAIAVAPMANAKGKNCDKSCEVKNASIVREAARQNILTSPALTRKILITFATPASDKWGKTGDKTMLATVKSASDACMLSLAPDAKRIFDKTISGNQLISNAWSAIIAGAVTSTLDFATSQVLGSIVEKALNEILANRNYQAVRFMNWNIFKDSITGQLWLCN
jgi:hypothetical protein